MIALLRIIQCIEQEVRKDLRYCSTFRNLQGTAKRVFFESPVEHLQKDWESTIKLQHPVELSAGRGRSPPETHQGLSSVA